MKLTKMNLVGHSLGGYISTKYAALYPDRVSRLILLSPLGVEESKSEFRKSWRRPEIDESCCRKYLFSLGKCLVRNDKSPLDVLRCLGRFIAPFLIKDVLKKRLHHFPEEDMDHLYAYFYQITLARGSGEYAMSKLIELTLQAYEPLYMDLLYIKDQNIPISLAYGDEDYINTEFNDQKISETLVQDGFDVHIIPQCSHQVYLDQPMD